MPAFHAGDSDSNSGISTLYFMISSIFLEETAYIDYSHPLIARKADVLFAGLNDDEEKIKAAYYFVRDEIPHTFDIMGHAFPVKASEVLACKTGICHAKANLLAAFLRREGIPTGFSFLRMTLADDDRHGYCLHGFNAVYLDGRWVFLDARGNKPGIEADYSRDDSKLAYYPRAEYDEYFIPGVFAKPDPAVMKHIERCHSLADVMTGFPDAASIRPDIE